MDNNNNQNQMPPQMPGANVPQMVSPQMPQPQMVPPQMPQPTMQVPVMPEKEKSSGKLIFFLIFGVLIIGLIVGGVYLYMSGNLKNLPLPFPVNKAENTVQKTEEVVPTAEPVKEQSVDTQLNAINIATDDADFTPIDQDLESL